MTTLNGNNNEVVSTNNVNDINNKGDKNMMNRKNNKDARIETMKKAGVDTTKFFDLNLRVPFGAEVKLVVDGREVIFGRDDEVTLDSQMTGVAEAVPNGLVVAETADNNQMIEYSEETDATTTWVDELVPENEEIDPIVQHIEEQGYIFNPKTDGRWVTAQTFKLLNGDFYNPETKQYEHGWDAGIRLGYSYMYCFTMMADELHRLAKMEASNDPEFAQVSRFFTKKVVVETCKHYIRQLKKYIKHQPTRKYKGKPYVKLARYGNVLVKDLDKKVYRKLEFALGSIENVNGYKMIERKFREFMSVMSKLPCETPKCSAWKDAFKGKGAYLTLLNIIKFGNVKVQNYETKEVLDRDESVAYVESLLDTYKNEYWKYHELLKATIKFNNFDLRKSIEAQKEGCSNK